VQTSPAGIVARLEYLQRETKRLKATIKKDREALQAVAREREALEATCRRHGFSLVIVHPQAQKE
jgi:cell division protein FtsB